MSFLDSIALVLLFAILWLALCYLKKDTAKWMAETKAREIKKPYPLKRKRRSMVKPFYCKGPVDGCHKEFNCSDCQSATELFLRTVVPRLNDEPYDVIMLEDEVEE
jgi:hypothetical protein